MDSRLYVEIASPMDCCRCTIADEEATEQVDQRDDDRGDRVALDELGGTVHRAVEVGLRRRPRPGGGAPASSSIRPELRSASIAICLPGIASRVNRAADLGDAAGTVGDDDELDDHQDHEDHQADDQRAADDEVAEGLDHLAGEAVAAAPGGSR